MVLVGVLARIDGAARDQVCAALEALPGVSTFSVDDRLRLGILVERESLDDAHRAVTEEIQVIHGLLSAAPVFAHLGDSSDTETRD